MCLAAACRQLYKNDECTELVLVGVYDKSKGGGGDEFVAELRNVAAPCPVMADGPIADVRELVEVERSAEVFVYPSEDALGEACPIAPMEAMALGVPTVVSNMACYMDYVRPGKNAIVFDTGDVDSLGSALGRILRGCEDIDRLSAGAVDSMSVYSRANVARKYEDLMRGLLHVS